MSNPQKIDSAMSGQVLSRPKVLQLSQGSFSMLNLILSVHQALAPSILANIMERKLSACKLAITSNRDSQASNANLLVERLTDDLKPLTMTLEASTSSSFETRLIYILALHAQKCRHPQFCRKNNFAASKGPQMEDI